MSTSDDNTPNKAGAGQGDDNANGRIIRVPANTPEPVMKEVETSSADGLNVRLADAIERTAERASNLGQRVQFDLTYWVALVALLATCASGWLTSATISGSNFRAFQITGATILDPEPQKMAAHNSQMLQLIEAISLHQNAGEYTLAFRQAEMAFYSDEPFIYYISDSIAEIYETETPEALLHALQARNIRYFALPHYS
jgi:hypothetical protein